MTSPDTRETSPTDAETCDLVIVGAGLAGMNALFVASRYLGGNQRVLLVDRRERVGGMWIDTYPYVRLHQPHPMFTAGNIPWTLNRDRGYLASQGEVLDHFEHCLEVIRQRVRVDGLFGWELESASEIDGALEGGGGARIVLRSSDGGRRVIRTQKLIKAYGFGVQPNVALETSSSRVRSESPNSCDIHGGDFAASNAPIWVIGGGKTAMDTAHALIISYPGREVNMVVGSGTFFLSRDRSFPAGARRWWSGTLLSASGAQMLEHFDGTNEAEAAAWFRTAHGTSPTPEASHYLLGILSEGESRAISDGVTEIVKDYFVDVVDRGDASEMVLRSGATKTIARDSWILNCTGYVLRNDEPYEPYVSPGGSILSIQMRSATLHLSSFIAYFLTHMMYRGSLVDTPLYELDAHDLRQKSKAVLPFGMLGVAQYNLSLIYEVLPSTVFLECGSDVDRWYPLTRRMLGSARFVLTHRRARERARQTLDTVRERFDVRCGPLITGTTRSGDVLDPRCRGSEGRM